MLGLSEAGPWGSRRAAQADILLALRGKGEEPYEDRDQPRGGEETVHGNSSCRGRGKKWRIPEHGRPSPPRNPVTAPIHLVPGGWGHQPPVKAPGPAKAASTFSRLRSGPEPRWQVTPPAPRPLVENPPPSCASDRSSNFRGLASPSTLSDVVADGPVNTTELGATDGVTDAQVVAASEAACHAFQTEHGKTGIFTADSLIVLRDGIPVAEYGAF